MTGPGLEDLMRQYQTVQATIARLSIRYDPQLLHGLMNMAPIKGEDFHQPETLSAWCADLNELMNLSGGHNQRYQIEIEADGLICHRYTHGLDSKRHLPKDFFDGADYQAMIALGANLAGLIQPGAVVRKGKHEQSVGSFAEAENWLMDQAKKGRSIQRFKGLGEMNPEQLWETTVNPETRRLLKVTIEDAVAADEVFSTLMGDIVEPRRDFIEKNALDVTNLDI